MFGEKKVFDEKKVADVHAQVNIVLLEICLIIFTFIVTIKPDLLKNLFLATQIVMTIPFLMSSVFARSKLACSRKGSRWQTLGFVTFVIAYSFLINTLGILIATFVSGFLAVAFFVVNILSALIYSAVTISYDRSKLSDRIFKDLAFIILIVLLGLLPSIGVY